jgi:hypothetical protein
VSDQGNVRSLDRYQRVPLFNGTRPRTMGRRFHRGRVLKPWPDVHGVLKVTLCPGDNRYLARSVHRLVLEAFEGPWPPGMEALHGPAGRRDNSRANLRWGTRSQNLGPDRRRDGTDNGGERHSLAKLTSADVAEIRRRCAAGERQRAVAAEFSVSQQQVSKIVTGKRWPAPACSLDIGSTTR